MRVTQGVKTEYARDGFEISLEHEDWLRLCAEFGISQESPSLDQKYALMTLEVERYVLVQAPKFGRDVATVRRQLLENREQFAALVHQLTGEDLDQLRKRAGLTE